MARDDRSTAPEGTDDMKPSAPSPIADLPMAFRELIALSALLMSLTALSIDIMLPALPRIGAAFGIATANDQQLVVTFYFLGLAGGQLFYGPLSDRFGRKPLLLAGLSIYLLGAFAAVAVADFRHLLWARLLQGFGGAGSRVMAVAVVRDLFSGRQMARVMSIVMMVFIVVPIFAPAVGQQIARFGDWRAIFYFLICVALVDLAWSSGRLPETRKPRGPDAPGYGEAIAATFANRTTVGYSVASGFLFGCLTSYIASAQQIFGGVYQLGAKFPLAFGLVASLIAAASFTNSRLVVRHGMRRVSHMALVGFIGMASLLVLGSTFGTPPLLLFGVLMGGSFYAFGLMMSNFNAIGMQPMGHVAGTAASLGGFYATGAGATFGWLIAGQFDGTVRPIAIGFLVLGLATLAAIVWTEGRDGLFKGE